MTKPNDKPSFNLWTEPWIMLEDEHGRLTRHGIGEALQNVPRYRGIHDLSPLVVVGVHRLLVAILQDALRPQENADLEALWNAGEFPLDELRDFEARYNDRFDLFSEDKPFMQSTDLPMFPKSKADLKESTSVARLFVETPSGTEIAHYRHGLESDNIFSPLTAALGLVAIPPFISSGGPGLMPSINGVPPVYVLPGGRTLFERLLSSLVCAEMLRLDHPNAGSDLAWWARPVPVRVNESEKKTPSSQLARAGYLHGLTFPARKVRLHPERLNMRCTRSGEESEWNIRTMAFRMGESLREDASFWRDPFVAYRSPTEKRSDQPLRSKATKSRKAKDKPHPIRPKRGKALWREFDGLFLQSQSPETGRQQTQRPLFIDQLSNLGIFNRVMTYPFQCVAFQTDGKMKFFEWSDFGFDIPPMLLQHPQGALWVDQALDYVSECATTIKRVFTRHFERYKHLNERMEADFWSVLAGDFRNYYLQLGARLSDAQTVFADWVNATTRRATDAFNAAADATGNDGHALCLREQAKAKCMLDLNELRRKHTTGVTDEQTNTSKRKSISTKSHRTRRR